MSDPVQPWALADLTVPALLKRGRRVTREDCDAELRLAVLGDCATQHYRATLEACVKLRGVWAEVYEAEFDTIQFEVLDPNSGLRAHRPQAVVLFNCLQALEHRFPHADPATFADDVAAEIVGTWDRIGAFDAVVVQHTFCLPVSRTMGGFSARCPGTFAHAVARINALLADEAAARDGVRLVDTDWHAAYFGKREWLDERLWCQAKQALSPKFLPPLAKAVSDVLLEGTRPAVKCVVLDLDNTCWGGVLGDAGLEGIELGGIGEGMAFTRFQEFVLQLERRGILLAVCSKNEQANAERVFAEHPEMVLRPQHIAKLVANYDDKAGNILAIQQTLNIGLDSFVFLDDSPFERDFVRTALPEVQVPDLPEEPAEVLSALARWNLFETSRHTAEDANRTQLYKANAERDQLRAQATDLGSYLAQLQMVAELAPIDSVSLPRALQLVQRSNQFNLTTRRHPEGVLRRFAEDGFSLTVRLRDRLGDNGIIALVLGAADGGDLVVDSWIMSCRVLNRRVEELTLAAVVEGARRLGCDRVLGQYLPSPKNGMVAELFPRLGFTPIERPDGAWFALPVAAYERPDFPISITTDTAPEGTE